MKKDSRVNGIRVPILMYHHITDNVTSEFMVGPEKFQSDIGMLKEEGYEGIFLTDLLGYLNGNIELPEKPIIITMDDGYLNNYEHAFQILKEFKMKATIAIIGWAHGRSKSLDNSESIVPHFGWDETREMLNSGLVDIQNHTFDLHSREGLSYGYKKKSTLGILPFKNEDLKPYEERIRDDVLQWNLEIFKETNHMPKFFFYPYGAFNENTEEVISKLGFKGTISIIEGVRLYEKVKDLQLMPRLNIPNELKGKDLLEAIDKLPVI